MSISYRPIVAIAGLNGALGQQTLAALLSQQFIHSFQLPIRVLTRQPMSLSGHGYHADMAVYLGVNYNDPEGLDAALEDVDVVINLLGMYPSSWSRLGESAYRIGAKLYIPSEFGPDHRYIDYQSPLAHKQVQSDRARADGIKTVQIFCGILMERAIPMGRHLGIDLPGRQITAVVCAGRPEPRVSFTSVRDVAMSIASVASRRPCSLPDVVRIAGETMTLRQLGECYRSLVGGARVRVTTKDYAAAFSASTAAAAATTTAVTSGGRQNLDCHYQLAAGAGLVDYGYVNLNDWVNAGMWQWRSVQQFLAENQPLSSTTIATPPHTGSIRETRAARRRRIEAEHEQRVRQEASVTRDRRETLRSYGGGLGSGARSNGTTSRGQRRRR